MFIDKNGYVSRRMRTGYGRAGSSPKRNWFLIKNKNFKIDFITIPMQYLGKRIRLKIEIVENEIPKEIPKWFWIIEAYDNTINEWIIIETKALKSEATKTKEKIQKQYKNTTIKIRQNI